MKLACEALIIGAGIVGTACALELVRAGLSVTVIESESVGGGATAAGMGHIVAMDDSPAQLALTRYSQLLWDELAEADPNPHEYNQCGTLWVAADEIEMAAVAEKQALFRQYDIATQLVDQPELYRLEPSLAPGLNGGLLVPGDSVVYPPSSAAYLLQKATQLGAVFQKGRVVELVPQGVKLADGTILKAENIILAGGWQAKELLPDLPMRAKKGHLLITDRYPGFLKHQLVEIAYVKNAHASEGDSVSFNAQPRATGQILLGSSRQYDIDHADVDYKILTQMLSRALEYIPGLKSLSTIRIWTGVRAATLDGLPLIGAYPGQGGVWLATGHEGLGITSSLGTARLLTAQILGQSTDIPAEPYLPARFTQELAHV